MDKEVEDWRKELRELVEVTKEAKKHADNHTRESVRRTGKITLPLEKAAS